jgi:hypothetical protein
MTGYTNNSVPPMNIWTEYTQPPDLNDSLLEKYKKLKMIRISHWTIQNVGAF